MFPRKEGTQMSLLGPIIVLIIFLTTDAAASPVNLSGRMIEAVIPTGYCEADAHPTVIKVMDRVGKTIGNSNQILAMFADCKELIELREGGRKMLDNYGLILAQTPKDKLLILKGVARSEYIKTVKGQVNYFPDAIKKAETRVKQFVPGLGVENLGMLSADSNGIYIGLLMTMADETERPRATIAVMGMTLVREISITINIYQAYWNSPDLRGLLARQQAAMATFVRANN